MDYTDRAVKYATAITKKKTPACKYTILACKRFLKDLKRKDIKLDKEAANKWCSFLEKLPHVKGKWAAKRERFKLSDYQVFCTVNIFGWIVKKTGRRRFRSVYIEVPRKNGKSFWFGGIGVGMLCIDGEHGAEVYCGATSEAQAWEVFRPAKLICEMTPKLRHRFRIEVNAKSLTILENGSTFKPIIGNPGDGASPSCAIVDEFHEHATSDQVDTMETGMGAREQPLLLKITTAGSDTGGPCYEHRDDLIKVLEGTAQDDGLFGIIYSIDEDDEWDTVEAQIKANPNYGISVDPEFLRAQLEQARRSPMKQAAYKTKHLNMWVGAKSAWMNLLAYQSCRKKDLDLELFRGKRCYVGIDLASKTDIASMAIVFPEQEGVEKTTIFCKHYLPDDTILEGGNTRYKGWHASGWITSTPGNVIDYEYIEDDLKQLKSDYEIADVAYDPFQATQFATRMLAEGFPMVEYGQTVKNFSQPMKELDALILSKRAQFTHDPVLFWMFGNVVAKLDKKDNIFPDKERKENKIDGVIATIMAVARMMLDQNANMPDDYKLMVI